MSVDLMWDVPHSESPLLRYTVYRAAPSGWEPAAIVPPDQTATTLSAEPDISHYFTVTATNAFGESLIMTYTWAQPYGPEPNPPSVTAELQGADAQVAWEPSTGTPFTGHRVYRGGELMAELGADARTWTDPALAPGTYHYEVASVNEHGESARSSARVHVPTPVDPRAPRNLALTWSDRGAVLTWEPPSGPSGQVARYVVYRSRCESSSPCTERRIGTTLDLTFTDNNPPRSPCGGIWYRVAAVDDDGEGPSATAGYGEGTNC